jgi:hypothetical protein
MRFGIVFFVAMQVMQNNGKELKKLANYVNSIAIIMSFYRSHLSRYYSREGTC